MSLNNLSDLADILDHEANGNLPTPTDPGTAH